MVATEKPIVPDCDSCVMLIYNVILIYLDRTSLKTSIFCIVSKCQSRLRHTCIWGHSKCLLSGHRELYDQLAVLELRRTRLRPCMALRTLRLTKPFASSSNKGAPAIQSRVVCALGHGSSAT